MVGLDYAILQTLQAQCSTGSAACNHFNIYGDHDPVGIPFQIVINAHIRTLPSGQNIDSYYSSLVSAVVLISVGLSGTVSASCYR